MARYDFRAARSSLMRKEGNEPVHLAVELQLHGNFAANGLQRATRCANREACSARDQPIGDPRGKLARQQRVLPLFPPAMNEVVAFVELANQRWNVERVVLQIAIKRNDHFARRMLDSRLHGRGLAIVAAKADNLDPLVAASEFVQSRSAAIGGAVIDKDDFPRPP